MTEQSPPTDVVTEQSPSTDDSRLSRIARVALGAGLRVVLALLLFELAMVAVLAFVPLVWPLSYNFRSSRIWTDCCVASLAMEGLLALGVGALRLVEVLASYLRPSASYMRKVVFGGVVGGGVFVLMCGFLFQLYYVIGLAETGSIQGAFQRIAFADWFKGGASSHYGLEDVRMGTLVGLAVPFALCAFGRARELPILEQTALAGAFVLLLHSPTFVFWGTMGHNYSGFAWSGWSFSNSQLELGAWIVIWLTSTSVPLVARLGDAVDERWGASIHARIVRVGRRWWGPRA